jgi:hypothetical protein
MHERCDSNSGEKDDLCCGREGIGDPLGMSGRKPGGETRNLDIRQFGEVT